MTRAFHEPVPFRRQAGSVLEPPFIVSLLGGLVLSYAGWSLLQTAETRVFGGDQVGQTLSWIILWIGLAAIVHLLWRRLRIRADARLTHALARVVRGWSENGGAGDTWPTDLLAYAVAADRRRGDSCLLMIRCRSLAAANLEHLDWRSSSSLAADLDRHEKDTALSIPRLIIWALPVLGFIGTVIGISGAISAFSHTMGSIQGADEVATALKENIPLVTTQLSTAFDTTLIGLVTSVAAMSVYTLVERSEERYLDALDEVWQTVVAPALCGRAAGEVKDLAAATDTPEGRVSRSLQQLSAQLDLTRARLATWAEGER